MLGRRRAEPKSREGGGQLERELARTVREVVLGLVRTPIVLRDPGVGRTLDEYYVARGVRIRIAEVPRQDGSMEYCSFADEPGLTVLDEVLYAKTLRSIFELMDPEKVLRGFDPGTFFREALRSTAKKIGAQLDEERELRLLYYLNREVLRHGVIEPWMLDRDIEDIKVIRPGYPVLVVHRRFSAYGWLLTNAMFTEARQLDELIIRLARMGRRPINPAQPIADFTTSEGVRMAAALSSEVTRYGSALSIRKFPETPYSIVQLIKQNVLSPLMAAYMWFIMEKKALFFIAGPTGSGKTTLLNALLGLINPLETVHTIEEVFEISPPTPRYIGFTIKRGSEASGVEIGIPDILKLNLRMRPDYLIVGEIRTARDLNVFLDVAGTGHSGLATIHASNPDYLLMRLRAMGIDPAAAEKLWGCAVTLPALRQGSSLKRRVVTVADFTPTGAQEVAPSEVSKWLPESDGFEPTSAEELFERSPRLKSYAAYMKISKDTVVAEIETKLQILESLARENITGYEEVAKTIAGIVAAERAVERWSA
jgi:flagellar protein FlaI